MRTSSKNPLYRARIQASFPPDEDSPTVALGKTLHRAMMDYMTEPMPCPNPTCQEPGQICQFCEGTGYMEYP